MIRTCQLLACAALLLAPIAAQTAAAAAPGSSAVALEKFEIKGDRFEIPPLGLAGGTGGALSRALKFSSFTGKAGQFLRELPGTIMMSLAAPIVASGGPPEWIGAAVCGAVAWFTRSLLGTILQHGTESGGRTRHRPADADFDLRNSRCGKERGRKRCRQNQTRKALHGKPSVKNESLGQAYLFHAPCHAGR